MKILYVTTLSNTLNAFLIPHIDHLLQLGHEVSIACALEQPLAEYFDRKKIKRYSISFDRNPYGKGNIFAYRQLKRLITAETFDVIHTHTPIASGLVRLACHNSTIPIFYTAHGFHFYKGSPWVNWLIYYPIEWFLARWTDKIITINQEDHRLSQKKFGKKKSFLINGVGLPMEEYESLEIDKQAKRRALGVEEKELVFLSVGELNRNKNHLAMIQTFSQLGEFDFHYFICGEGPLKEKLNKRINQLGLQEKVTLLGYRRDVIEIMKISDAFLFPSLREGLPVSVMEAMAVGVPVLCSDIRGNHDLITDKWNGFLFDLKDEQLQEKIEQLVACLNNEYGRKIIKKAKLHLRNYSQVAVLRSLEKLYRS